MVAFDVVTLLVGALYAHCKVGFPLSLQGPGETKPVQQWTEPRPCELPLKLRKYTQRRQNSLLQKYKTGLALQLM